MGPAPYYGAELPGSSHSLPIYAAETDFIVSTDSRPITVTEFHHAVLGHYFITADAAEAKTLTDGMQPGWAQTGQQFKALSATAQADANAAAVCRSWL